MKEDVDATQRGEAVLLRTWADLTFLMWKNLAGGNVQNLKHIFRAPISNDRTFYYAMKAVTDVGMKIGGWADRVTFTETGVEGVATAEDKDKGNGLRAISYINFDIVDYSVINYPLSCNYNALS